MANPPIDPVRLLAQVEDIAPAAAPAAPAPERVGGGSIFDDMLGRAIDSLNSVSETEINANRLMDLYVQGKVELSEVMLATSKMTIAVQLAVTTITNAVSSFKELTQMPI